MSTANTIAIWCPQLGELLPQLSSAQLRLLSTQLCRAMATRFRDMPEAIEIIPLLDKGDRLPPTSVEWLRELSQQLDLKTEELGETSKAGRESFRRARWVYAVSLLAGTIDLRRANEILYELANADPDETSFFASAVQLSQQLIARSTANADEGSSHATKQQHNPTITADVDLQASSLHPRNLIQQAKYWWWMWRSREVQQGKRLDDVLRILGDPAVKVKDGPYKLWFYPVYKTGHSNEGVAVAFLGEEVLARYWRIQPAQ